MKSYDFRTCMYSFERIIRNFNGFVPTNRFVSRFFFNPSIIIISNNFCDRILKYILSISLYLKKQKSYYFKVANLTVYKIL